MDNFNPKTDKNVAARIAKTDLRPVDINELYEKAVRLELENAELKSYIDHHLDGKFKQERDELKAHCAFFCEAWEPGFRHYERGRSDRMLNELYSRVPAQSLAAIKAAAIEELTEHMYEQRCELDGFSQQVIAGYAADLRKEGA